MLWCFGDVVYVRREPGYGYIHVSDQGRTISVNSNIT